jgi:hypothetical protein
MHVFRSREIEEGRLVKELSQNGKKMVGPSIIKFIYTLLDAQKHLALK